MNKLTIGLGAAVALTATAVGYVGYATHAAYNDSSLNFSYEMVPWHIGKRGEKVEGKDRIYHINYPLFFPDVGFGIPIGYVDVRFSQINPPRMKVLSIKRNIDYFSWKDKLEIHLYEPDNHPDSELQRKAMVVIHNNANKPTIQKIDDDPIVASIVKKVQKDTKEYYEGTCKPHLEERVKSM